MSDFDGFTIVKKRCGTCNNWMKKGDCPREKGMMKGGPASEDFPCEKYEMSDYYKRNNQEEMSDGRS